MANLRKLWGFKHSQVGVSNTEPFPDLSKSPHDDDTIDYGFSGEHMPDGADNSALFYQDATTNADPYEALGFLYQESKYKPMYGYTIPNAYWGESFDMRYALKPGTDLILHQINALEDMAVDWGSAGENNLGGLDNNFDVDNWMTGGRDTVEGTNSRACIYQVSAVKSNLEFCWNDTADGPIDPYQSNTQHPIFGPWALNTRAMAHTDVDFWYRNIQLEGEQGDVNQSENPLDHSTLRPEPIEVDSDTDKMSWNPDGPGKNIFLKYKQTVHQAAIVSSSSQGGHMKYPVYNKTVDIAYEIEQALSKYGVNHHTMYIKNGTGIRGVTILSYVAGHMAFSASEYDQNAGSHMLIPCYVRMKERDYSTGKYQFNKGSGPYQRYVMVAIRLANKYAPGSYIRGSGCVIEMNQTTGNYISSPEQCFAESNSQNEGWDNYVGDGDANVDVLNNPTGSTNNMVRCFRWMPGGEAYFIVGGNVGSSAPTKSGGGSNLYHCIKKMAVNVADAGGSYGSGPRNYFYQTNKLPVGQSWTYKYGPVGTDIKDMDPRETGIVDNAWVGGREVKVGTTYYTDKYGFNGTTASNLPNEVSPKVPTQSFSTYGSGTVYEEILSFRWSDDGRYLYILWGIPQFRKTSISQSGDARAWIARYYATVPYQLEGLKWAGETGSEDTPLTPPNEANNNFFSGPWDFTISPDGNTLIVLDNPYNNEIAFNPPSDAEIPLRCRFPSLSQYDLGAYDEERSSMPEQYIYQNAAYYYVLDEDSHSFRYSTSPAASSVRALKASDANFNAAAFANNLMDSKAWWKWPQDTVNLGAPAEGTIKDNSNGSSNVSTYKGANWFWINQSFGGTQTDSIADSYVAWENRYQYPGNQVKTYTQTVHPTAIEWNHDGSVLYMFQANYNLSKGRSYTRPASEGGGSYYRRPYGDENCVVMWPMPLYPDHEWYPNPDRPGGQYPGGGGTEISQQYPNGIGMAKFNSNYRYPFLFNYTLRPLFEQIVWKYVSIGDHQTDSNPEEEDYQYRRYAIPPAAMPLLEGSQFYRQQFDNYEQFGDGADSICRDRFSIQGGNDVDTFAIPLGSWRSYTSSTQHHRVYVFGATYDADSDPVWQRKVVCSMDPSGHWLTVLGQQSPTPVTDGNGNKTYAQYTNTFPIYTRSHERINDVSTKTVYDYQGTTFVGTNGGGNSTFSSGSNPGRYCYFPLYATNIRTGVVVDDNLAVYTTNAAGEMVLGPRGFSQPNMASLKSLRWGRMSIIATDDKFTFNCNTVEDNGLSWSLDLPIDHLLQDTTLQYMSDADNDSMQKLAFNWSRSNSYKTQVSWKDLPATESPVYRGRQFQQMWNKYPLDFYMYGKDRRGGKRGISIYMCDYLDREAHERFYGNRNKTSNDQYDEVDLLNGHFFTMQDVTGTNLDELPMVRVNARPTYRGTANSYLLRSTSVSPVNMLTFLDTDRTTQSPIIYKKELPNYGDLSTAYRAYVDGGKTKLNIRDDLDDVTASVGDPGKFYFKNGFTNQGPWDVKIQRPYDGYTSERCGVIRSIRYENDGKLLFVLWSGLIEEMNLWNDDGVTVDATYSNLDMTGLLIKYNLSTPYDIGTATIADGFIRSFQFDYFSRSWIGSTRRTMPFMNAEFCWHPDGTKFWMIGIETTYTGGFSRPYLSETRVREYTCGSAWDLTDVTETSNVKVYDTNPLGNDRSSYQPWYPCNLELSPDGTKVYWSVIQKASTASTDDEDWSIKQFQSNLLSAYDVTDPTQSSTEVIAGRTRTFAGVDHPTQDGGAEKIRFIGDQGRLYRTNYAYNAGANSKNVSQSWPLGGISVFDPDQKTQKRPGQISIGNYAIFPIIDNTRQLYRTSQPNLYWLRESQTFNFAVNPREDTVLINDSQTVIYQLLFNNQTRTGGIGP